MLSPLWNFQGPVSSTVEEPRKTCSAQREVEGGLELEGDAEGLAASAAAESGEMATLAVIRSAEKRKSLNGAGEKRMLEVASAHFENRKFPPKVCGENTRCHTGGATEIDRTK